MVTQPGVRLGLMACEIMPRVMGMMPNRAMAAKRRSNSLRIAVKEADRFGRGAGVALSKRAESVI